MRGLRNFQWRRAFDSDSTQTVIISMQRFEAQKADWRDTPDPLRQLIVSMMESDASERMTDHDTINRGLDNMLSDLPH